MEGLQNLTQEFLRDQGARGRAQEVDRARESRLGPMRQWFEAFARGELALADLATRVSGALRETTLVRGVPLLLWGFKNDDERLFPERLAAAAARAPEVDLQNVLAHLVSEVDSLSDDERVNRLLAFADFVADLDGRGAEGDPRLGVGPSANFLTFAWHVLTQGREAVFLFDSNKAIKAVAEASQDPQLQARDLEGRFRAFYLVAREIASATQGNQPALRPGWAVEHVLEYVVERTGAVGQLAQSLASEDASQSGLWRPRSRAEVRLRPPSGRNPALGSGTPSPRPTVTIERPKNRPESTEARVAPAASAAPAAPPAAPTPPAPPAPPASPASPERRTDRERPDDKTDRFFGLSKAKTIMADAPAAPTPPAPEPPAPRAPEPREMITSRGLPRIAARGGSPAADAKAPVPAAPTPPAPPVAPQPPSPPVSLASAVAPAAPGPTIAPAPAASPPPTIAPQPPVAPQRTSPPPGAAPADVQAWVHAIAPPPPTAGPAPAPPRPASEPSTPALGSPRPAVDRSSKLISQELVAQAVGELIGEIAIAEAEPSAETGNDSEDETWRSDRLAREISVDDDFLANALGALATRGRVLLAGPLATGKSYVARRLALHVARSDDKIVQLRGHPGLGYDELVDAWGPGGEVRAGVFRELLERARKDREGRYALVIDDVDRADLGRALGELMPALSERGAEVLLARSRVRVSLPKNLVLIATARSVPLDLLGRFPVVESAPDEEALRRYLQRSRPALAWAADLLREANARILRERGPGARLGHGLLMDPELDLGRLEGIWRREVLPIVRALGLDPRAYEIAQLKKS